MPIDLSIETGLSPTQAAVYFPSYKSGKPSHPSKVVRAIVDGTLLPDGRREYLEALRLGNQWVTTVRAIREYGERVAAAKILKHRASQGTVGPAKSKSAAMATQELDRRWRK